MAISTIPQYNNKRQRLFSKKPGESRYERLSREFDEDMNGGSTRTRAKNAVDAYNNMFMSPDRDYDAEDDADYKMGDKISPKGWLSSQWQKYGGIVKYDNHGRPVFRY